MPSLSTDRPFEDTEPAPTVLADRFAIKEQLGVGGMGVVYRAFDVDQERDVALKTLTRATPTQIYFLKQEFRTLADLRHDNLVRHFDLVIDGTDAFITMEIIEGLDLVHYVRGDAPSAPSSTQEDTQPVVRSEPGTPPTPPPLEAGTWSDEMEPRLRAALAQLAEGLSVLHHVGVIHRDIKPGNVLVEERGDGDIRVVLLDFGVSVRTDEVLGTADVMVGTPGYLAPEVVRAARVGPEADLFALGVILFEALTGRVPYAGDPEALAGRWQRKVPSVETLVPNAPHDLCALTHALLDLDPRGRPTIDEVVATICPEKRPLVTYRGLVGRERELRQLEAGIQKDGAQVIAVRGASGIGKTALLEAFARQARYKGAFVLQGRCLSQETIPYSALDSLVDALSRTLLIRGACELPAPARVSLSRAFPVLGRVAGLTAPHDAAVEAARDIHEVRREAVDALRRLVEHAAEGRRLVLVVDDLHWADVDSLPVLVELLRDRDALTVISYRPPDASALDGVDRALAAFGPEATIDTLELRPLEVAAIVEILDAEDTVAERDVVAEAAAELDGNPFLAHELSRHWQLDDSDVMPSVHELLEVRLSTLPPDGRPLLEQIALSAAPMPRSLLPLLVDDSVDVHRIFEHLVASHLVRIVSRNRQTHIELTHDRFRQHLTGALDEQRLVRHHDALADFWAAVPGAEPALIAHHFAAAGRHSEAAVAALEAARRGVRGLAFDHASTLFDQAASYDPLLEADVRFRRERAEARAAAGLVRGAADDWLAAAECADSASDRVDDERRAAELLLSAGMLEEGRELLGRALQREGMRLPSGIGSAVFAGLARARLGTRRLGVLKPADRPASNPDLLRRVDLCWTVAAALGTFDALASFGFQTRHLLWAQDAQEPARLARAIAMELIYTGSTGRRQQRVDELRGLLDELVVELTSPEDVAFHTFARGYARMLEGGFVEAQQELDEAAQQFAALGEVRWERDHCRNYAAICCDFLGRPAELERRARRLSDEYRRRENRLSAAQLDLGGAYLVDLWRGAPAAARDRLDNAARPFGESLPMTLFYLDLVARCRIDLYEGRPAQAAERLASGQSRARPMRTFQNARMMLDWLELVSGPTDKRAAIAARWGGEGEGWASGLERPSLGEDPVTAAQLVRARGMELFAAALEWGARSDAAAVFEASGARDPAAFARAYGALTTS